MKQFKQILKFRIAPILVISLIITSIIVFLNKQRAMEGLELKTLDLRFVMRNEREFKNKKVKDLVKVIAIDEQTIEKVGRWSWPRGVLATLFGGICGDMQNFKGEVSRPIDGNKRVVGIDILFDREERPFKKYIYDDSAAIMDPVEQDSQLIQALGFCASTVLISDLEFTGMPILQPHSGSKSRGKKYTVDGREAFLKKPARIFLLPDVETGFSQVLQSVQDHRVRKTRLYYKLGDEYELSFAMMVLASHLGIEKKNIKVEERQVIVGPYKIPTNDSGEMYINFRGNSSTPRLQITSGQNNMSTPSDDTEQLFLATQNIGKENVFAALDIMEMPDLLPMLMQGDFIFLVGVTDPEIKDVFYTPFSFANKMYPNYESFSGVELHKEILDTILQGDYLLDVPTGKFLIILSAGVLIVTACTVFSLWAGIISMLACCTGYAYFALGAFTRSGEIYPVAAEYAALFLSLAAGYVYNNFVINKNKRFIQKTFTRYLDRRIVNELAKKGDLSILKGREKEVTVMFSDMRGFTTLSEKLHPEKIVQILNFHLSLMTNTILEYEGMVISYAGDAIMAVWNAPQDIDNHRFKACQCALKMQEQMEIVNQEIINQGIKLEIKLNIGIGLNSGETLVGNIGSEKKSDYTAIGDTTNVAARLEGLNKEFNTLIIISEAVCEGIKEKLVLKDLDFYEVKGRINPVKIYELISLK